MAEVPRPASTTGEKNSQHFKKELFEWGES